MADDFGTGLLCWSNGLTFFRCYLETIRALHSPILYCCCSKYPSGHCSVVDCRLHFCRLRRREIICRRRLCRWRVTSIRYRKACRRLPLHSKRPKNQKLRYESRQSGPREIQAILCLARYFVSKLNFSKIYLCRFGVCFHSIYTC